MNTILAPLTIDDVKELLPGVSERKLREVLRRLGCYSEIGGKMYLEVEDFKRLLKETKPCHSNSNGAEASPISAELLTVNAYDEALKLATQKSQPISKRRTRRVSSGRKSTAPKRRQPSLTLISSTTSSVKTRGVI